MVDNLNMGRIALIRRRLGSWLALSLASAVLLGCQQGTKPATEPAAGTKPVLLGNITEVTPAAGQNPSPGSAAPAAAGPRITFDEMAYDFGNIDPESKNTTQFTFKNTGTGILKIASVQPCCGTTTRGVEAGQAYAPGKGGALMADFTAPADPGPILRTIHITSNDPCQQIASLTFKAEVVRQVAFEPKDLRLFLKRENGGAENITLTSLNGQPFSITSFKSTAGCIKTDFDPAVKDTKFVLKLKTDMAKLKEHERGRIEITLTHPGCRSIVILYDVLPEFTVIPAQIMAFDLKPSEPIQKELWILSNYGDDFEIESVTSKNGTIKLIQSEKVKGTPGLIIGVPALNEADRPKEYYQYKLKLEIVPPQERSPIADTLLVAIKGGDTLTIECRGFYKD